jgi:hypothetical protein
VNPQALVASATSGSGMFKMLVSGIMGLLGMYYLAMGKKESDVNKMLIGGALTLASFLLF